MRIFGPRPEAAVQRALARVLAGPPSQLARELVSDLCQKELVDCTCCPAIISHMWRKSLPSNVQAGIAHMTFDSANFEAIIKLADDIFATNHASSSLPAVASIRQSPDDTLPAIPYPQPEVAAVQRGGRGGRGGRGRGRGGRGGRGAANQNQNPQSQNQNSDKPRGAKHPDLPAGEWKGCRMHYIHGKSAYFCAAPATCPWKDIFTPRPSNK